jgi:uncharacterized membrane protein YebE (DUF533 family)
MIDTRRLLDQFLGGGQQADQGGQVGQPPAGNQNPQGGLMGQAGGILGQAGTFARNNPLLAGGAAGGLAALLLGSKAGREIGGDVVKYGGMALIGGLAYKAYRDYQANKGQGGAVPAPQPAAQQGRTSVPVLPPPQDSGFAPADAPQGADSLAETLIVAMVSAAKADGHIDAEERGRIYERLEQGGLDAEEVAFMKRELAAPLDMERLVRAATTKEVAVEIYAASLMAIRADNPAEKGYLAMLAGRLGLEPELVSAIENTIAGEAIPA